MRLFTFIILFFLSAAHCKQVTTSVAGKNGGIAPEAALATFQIADGFKIEQIAAEPLLEDPIAMEIDEYGRLYVAEMPGYPSDLSKTGRIKQLTDTNGDGLPDKATVFADKLTLPGGLMRWKKGLIVVDPPDILYLEDTNGDGRADKREVLLTGFALSNPQHNANTPLFGLDNWIYIGHMGSLTPKIVLEFSDEGTEIHYPARPEAPKLPKNADGRNVRFQPEQHLLEMCSGETQYGHTFDAWGHHLGTENGHHLFHEVIAARYLARNPNLFVPDVSENMPDHGNACEVYAITPNPEHQLLTDVGVITSACGALWYLGGLFPADFEQVAFVCEPTHNLIHADHITDQGATFSASRRYEQREFLASTDPWFRPVFQYIGPDGALYVVDYYRQIIEHPEWMSEEANQSGALYNGTRQGRIYRITPTENGQTGVGASGKLDWLDRLKTGDATDAELVQLLESNNIWQRRTAQRLLLDRPHGEAVIQLLADRVIRTDGNPAGMAHALWTLHGMGKMEAGLLKKVLLHPTAGVRENGARIAEQLLAQYPDLESDLVALARDPDAKVRYQALLTLGFCSSKQAANARRAILVRDIEDRWAQYAALSAAPGSESVLFAEASELLSHQPTEGRRQFFFNCAGVTAFSKDTAQIRKMVQTSLHNPTNRSAWWQAATLEGLAAALQFNQFNPFGPEERRQLASCFSEKTPASLRRASLALLRIAGLPKWEFQTVSDMADRIRKVVSNPKADLEYRKDALMLAAQLAPGKWETSFFTDRLQPGEPVELQVATIAALQADDPINHFDLLAKHWKNLTPEVRNAAVDYFFDHDDNLKKLLGALEAGTIQQGTLPWPRQVSLMNHDDPDIRSRARALLSPNAEQAGAAIQQYRESLALPGDAGRGAAVYRISCAVCHQIGGKNGVAFGPDLGTIRNRQKEFILTDILNPNRSMADGYVLWTVVRKNGETVAGIIAAETAVSVTLRNPTGQDVTIPRSEIASITGSEVSAMPQGLENAISVAQMADLLAFLKQ